MGPQQVSTERPDEMALEGIDLGLKDVSQAAGGCCGGGGACACGHGAAEAPSAAGGETTTTVKVEGMTCSHCVNAVKEIVGGMPGVVSVSVGLVADGLSTVTVRSDAPLAPADLAAAIDEAGYTLV